MTKLSNHRNKMKKNHSQQFHSSFFLFNPLLTQNQPNVKHRTLNTFVTQFKVKLNFQIIEFHNRTFSSNLLLPKFGIQEIIVFGGSSHVIHRSNPSSEFFLN